MQLFGEDWRKTDNLRPTSSDVSVLVIAPTRFLMQIFYRAITITKSLEEGSGELKFDEIELKYRLYRCLLKQNKREEAVGVLGSIPEEQMPPKIKAALARLHAAIDSRDIKTGKGDTIANSSLYHKKVVEDCPEAIDSLTRVISSGILSTIAVHWSPTIQAWLNAHVAVAEKKTSRAISILSTVAQNNAKITVFLGLLHYIQGERQKATTYLQKVHHMEPSSSDSMDILAYMYAQDHKIKELENLAASLMETQESTEAYIAYALLAKTQKDYDKAMFFVQKACGMSKLQMHPIAMLLKALILMERKKFDEAVHILRDAIVFNVNNFDLYHSLVQAYLMQNKLHEARLVACNCRFQLGQDNARAIYLCAIIAGREGTTSSNSRLKDAQKLLERAISISPYLLDAVFLLVDLYDRTQNYDKAITLLKKQAETTVNSRLHRLLGDFLSKTNRPVDACHQYRLAVDGDPNAAKAMNALESMPGLNAPEGLASAICPNAPRRRSAAHFIEQSMQNIE